MKTIVVYFEFENINDLHEDFFNAISSYENSRIGDNLFLLSASSLAKEVHDHLKGFLDKNDAMFVAEINPNDTALKIPNKYMTKTSLKRYLKEKYSQEEASKQYRIAKS